MNEVYVYALALILSLVLNIHLYMRLKFSTNRTALLEAMVVMLGNDLATPEELLKGISNDND